MSEVVTLPRPAAHVRAARIAAEMIVAGVEHGDIDVLEQGMRLARLAHQSLVTATALLNELDQCEDDKDDFGGGVIDVIEHENNVSKLRHPSNQRDWMVNADGIVIQRDFQRNPDWRIPFDVV